MAKHAASRNALKGQLISAQGNVLWQDKGTENRALKGQLKIHGSINLSFQDETGRLLGNIPGTLPRAELNKAFSL